MVLHERMEWPTESPLVGDAAIDPIYILCHLHLCVCASVCVLMVLNDEEKHEI